MAGEVFELVIDGRRFIVRGAAQQVLAKEIRRLREAMADARQRIGVLDYAGALRALDEAESKGGGSKK